MDARRPKRPTSFLTTPESSAGQREGRSEVRERSRHVSRSLSREPLDGLSTGMDALQASVLQASTKATAALVQQAQALPDPVQCRRVHRINGDTASVALYEYERHNAKHDHHRKASVDGDVAVGQPKRRSLIPRVAGYTTMQATVDEFHDAFMQPPDAQALASDMTSSELLYTISEDALKHVSIQRLVLEPRGGGGGVATRGRDFVVVECRKRFRLRDGRHGWVQSLHSVEIPSHRSSSDCVRGAIYRSGVVAIASAVHKQTLDIIVTAQLDLGESASQGAHRAASKRRVAKVLDALQETIRQRRVETLSFPGTDRFVALAAEQHDRQCHVCADKLARYHVPGWRAARHTCRRCGATVCSGCSQVYAVERPRTSTLVGGGRVTTATRVCRQCMALSRDHSRAHANPVTADPRPTQASGFLGSASPPLPLATSRATMRPTQLEFSVVSERSASAVVPDDWLHSDHHRVMRTIRLDRP